MDFRKEYLSKNEKEKEENSGFSKLFGTEILIFILNIFIQIILYVIRHKGIWLHCPYFCSMCLIVTLTLAFGADKSLMKLFILEFLFIIFVALDFFLNIYFSEGIKKSDTILKVLYVFKIVLVINYICITISICYLRKNN